MSNVNIIVEEEQSKVGIRNNGAIVLDETNASRVVVEPESDASSICSSGPEDDGVACSATNTALSQVLSSRVLDIKALPPVSEINVRDSNDVHFGHKIYTAPVTVVQATDDIKGLNESWFIRRPYWHALDPVSRTFLKLPIEVVLIGHTVTTYCTTDAECRREVNQIQASHIRRRFDDIAYNYLIGKNGILFEGRGSNVVGTHTYRWNSKSIMIAFLGNYNNYQTDQLQWDHMRILLGHIERMGVLSPDYKIYGACQVTGVDSPGRNVMAGLGNLTHWFNGNLEDCENHVKY